jgi:hypothetical protein
MVQLSQVSMVFAYCFAVYCQFHSLLTGAFVAQALPSSQTAMPTVPSEAVRDTYLQILSRLLTVP